MSKAERESERARKKYSNPTNLCILLQSQKWTADSLPPISLLWSLLSVSLFGCRSLLDNVGTPSSVGVGAVHRGPEVVLDVSGAGPVLVVVMGSLQVVVGTLRIVRSKTKGRQMKQEKKATIRARASYSSTD